MPENNIVFEQLSNHHKEIDLFEIINKDTLEAYRIKYIGTKNILKELFGEIKNVPNERKKEFEVTEMGDLATFICNYKG